MPTDFTRAQEAIIFIEGSITKLNSKVSDNLDDSYDTIFFELSSTMTGLIVNMEKFQTRLSTGVYGPAMGSKLATLASRIEAANFEMISLSGKFAHARTTQLSTESNEIVKDYSSPPPLVDAIVTVTEQSHAVQACEPIKVSDVSLSLAAPAATVNADNAPAALTSFSAVTESNSITPLTGAVPALASHLDQMCKNFVDTIAHLVGFTVDSDLTREDSKDFITAIQNVTMSKYHSLDTSSTGV